MVRQSLVFFILFTSTEFFLLTYIPRGLGLLVLFACAIFMIMAVVIWSIYENRPGFPRNFNMAVILFLLSTVTAMFGAQIGHGQSFFLTFWVQSYMYFFFLYFFLHLVKLKPHELERIMIVIAIMFLFVYFAQYLIYPRLITMSRISMDRGTIRIFMPGDGFALLMYFYFLQKLFQSNNFKYGLFCMAYLMVPILQGTRNAIATIFLGTLIFILFSKYVKSRLVVILLSAIAFILFAMIFQDIILGLVEVSTEQASQEEDDIRQRSFKFYMTEFYPNKLNYLLGNGAGHMRSSYGLRLMYYQINYGYFISDLGIFNGYIKFGVLYLLGIFLLLRKIFIVKIDPKYNYIKFWAVIILIKTFSSYPFIFAHSIASIMTVLYIIDVSNYELKLKSITKT